MTRTHRIRTDSIHHAIAEIAAGRPVVVLDDADRENEGDLVMAASAVTPQYMGLFTRHGSGLICAPMPVWRAEELGLPLMVGRGAESFGTAFTVTVDARAGVSTGISAADRARTVGLLGDADATADDFVRPGHILPLRAHGDGLHARRGHTEAAVELVRLAGAGEVGVITELVEDDGSMRRAESCRRFADEHGLALITIEDLITSEKQLTPTAATGLPQPRVVTRVSRATLPTVAGLFTAYAYREPSGLEHLALVVGDVSSGALPVAVRVHSECLTGDALGSLRCDCGPQLQTSLVRLQRQGRGVLIYVRGHEGRGIGLAAKLAAYALQEVGRDTVQANLELGYPADAREYAAAAAILADLGVGPVRLLTNNPAKVTGLGIHGVAVVKRDGLVSASTAHNAAYLDSKRTRMGHDLPATDRTEVLS